MGQINYKTRVKNKIKELIKDLPEDWEKRTAEKLGIEPCTIQTYRFGKRGDKLSRQVKLLSALLEVKAEYESELEKLVS